jgi:hypothetical protein
MILSIRGATEENNADDQDNGKIYIMFNNYLFCYEIPMMFHLKKIILKYVQY